MHSTGMVQVLGTTYRVVRVDIGHYRVVRIRDDAMVGSFSCGSSLEVIALAVDDRLMRQVADAAVHGGRTSWLGPPASP